MKSLAEGSLAVFFGLAIGVVWIKVAVLFFAHCPGAKVVMDWLFTP